MSPGDAAADGSALGLAPGSSDGSEDGPGEPLGAGVRSGPPVIGDALGAALGTDPRPPVCPVQAASDATRMVTKMREEGRFMTGSCCGIDLLRAWSAAIADASPRGNDQVTGSRSSIRRPPPARLAAVR